MRGEEILYPGWVSAAWLKETERNKIREAKIVDMQRARYLTSVLSILNDFKTHEALDPKRGGLTLGIAAEYMIDLEMFMPESDRKYNGPMSFPQPVPGEAGPSSAPSRSEVAASSIEDSTIPSHKAVFQLSFSQSELGHLAADKSTYGLSSFPAVSNLSMLSSDDGKSAVELKDAQAASTPEDDTHYRLTFFSDADDVNSPVQLMVETIPPSSSHLPTPRPRLFEKVKSSSPSTTPTLSNPRVLDEDVATVKNILVHAAVPPPVSPAPSVSANSSPIPSETQDASADVKGEDDDKLKAVVALALIAMITKLLEEGAPSLPASQADSASVPSSPSFPTAFPSSEASSDLASLAGADEATSGLPSSPGLSYTSHMGSFTGCWDTIPAASNSSLASAPLPGVSVPAAVPLVHYDLGSEWPISIMIQPPSDEGEYFDEWAV
ncbi:hypothetical protein BKA70DRAFT_1268156 [Coprinopsis sp. MPI-PUGE-AT-0042]|nr:hypothetical protein BKA70DRAFT_1356354 [Coprinopsis sp. MPI-PUGE-AT-0042]KAH6911584.1 hypothetical protein BKA70DRAFT_1268156 [Coprinopsis sp. MPI-PUGE-AT-0042]